MGYSNLKKGYKVWSLEQKKVIFSRDVSFHETTFPFKNESHAILEGPNNLNQLNFFDNYEISSDLNPNDEEKVPTDSPTLTQQHSDEVESPMDSDTQQSSGTDGSSESNESLRDEIGPVRAEPNSVNDESNLPEGTIPTRRSSRSSTAPKRFEDFIVGNARYNYDKYVDYSSLPKENVCFAANINKLVEPYTYKDAIKDKRWVDAMNDELSALYRNNTWDIVDLPKGKKPIGCKWVFKVKYKSTGEIDRFKARLVAKGFNQREGIDFEETFSPVVKMVTVRCVISMSVQNNWPLYQLDVNNAFLYGNHREEVYMSLPDGLSVENQGKVCKLNKSLYGLKQAPRMWNERLVQVLVKIGFNQSKCDHSLFIKSANSVLIVLLVYVDDIVLTGNNEDEINKVKHLLKTEFLIKDLGLLKIFLGIEVIKTVDSVCLTQRKYCMDLLNEYGMSGSKPSSCPIEQNHVLTNLTKKESQMVDITQYQKLIGKLIYLSHQT
ncbi:putative RNA-directed DNA polymerase [Helianthus annuus]|nr:putative RNA-directed DNA polymerase [Helianthus annuus]